MNATLLDFRNRNEWRKWLEQNHKTESEVWLLYYKKNSKIKGIKYSEAVEEALCFGWIDSKVKSIDDERYMQKYTPRKKNSIWSELNKKRAKKLIEQGKMTEECFKKIEEAKNNGLWQSAYSSNFY